MKEANFYHGIVSLWSVSLLGFGNGVTRNLLKLHVKTWGGNYSRRNFAKRHTTEDYLQTQILTKIWKRKSRVSGVLPIPSRHSSRIAAL